MRTLVAIALVVGAIGAGRDVAADPIAPPRVIHAPVGRILPAGKVHATAGANATFGASHRGSGMLAFTAGLADIAELELGVADDVLTCEPCTDRATRKPVWPLVAGFKMGVNQDTWFRHQPALALGFRTTAGGRELPWTGAGAKIAEAYLAASIDVGFGLRLHGGAAMWASRHYDPSGAAIVMKASGKTIRPFAAFEFTPSNFPRTTLVGDVAWIPELDPAKATLRWIGGWGVRYQALSWGSIELEVRHREGDGLAGSTVLVRLDGVFGI